MVNICFYNKIKLNKKLFYCVSVGVGVILIDIKSCDKLIIKNLMFYWKILSSKLLNYYNYLFLMTTNTDTKSSFTF